MKKIFYPLVCLLFVLNCFASEKDTIQSPTLKNEISVSTRKLSFDNLSVKYARLISNDLWFKAGVIDLKNSFHKYIPSGGLPSGASFKSTDSSLNGGLLFGIEKHKSNNKLEVTYGLNVQMIYNYSEYTIENPNIPLNQRDINIYKFTPGIGIGLGCFYKINPSFLLGFEIDPSLNYAFINGQSESTGYAFKNRDFYFTFTNNGALFILKYRF